MSAGEATVTRGTFYVLKRNRDGSVSIVPRLQAGRIWVRFLPGIQLKTDFRMHPAACLAGTAASFFAGSMGVKPVTQLRLYSRSKHVELYHHFLKRLHGLVPQGKMLSHQLTPTKKTQIMSDT